jgi:hypothetical protein
VWGRQTFKLTRTSEAGVVSPVRDDTAVGTCPAYNTCRNASGCNEGLGVMRMRSRESQPPRQQTATLGRLPLQECSRRP